MLRGVARNDRAGVAGWVAVLPLVVVAVGVTVLRVADLGGMVGPLWSADMGGVHVDFDTFWHSAVALVHGNDIYDTPAELRNLNPPLVSLLLAPFAALDAVTAHRVFIVVMLLVVLGAVLAVCRELRLRAAVTAAVVAAVLASAPLYGTLLLGQVYPMLLAGLVAGWIAQRRGRPVLAAVLYGVTVALKPSLAPLLLLAAVHRAWAPFRAGIAAAAIASLVGVLAAGPSSAAGWLRIAFSEPVSGWVDNASLPGLAVRFGLPAGVGTALGLAVLTGTLWWCGRHRADPGGVAPWAVLAAGLLFSPIAWHNYLMLLWPGLLMLIVLGRGVITTAALALSAIPLSLNTEMPPRGITSALSQSLYCAILVGYWAVLLRGATRPTPGAPESPGHPAPAEVAAAAR
ncbi:glycosyltransferase family 87 protein [Nocardia sp. NPDC003693]